MGLRVLIGGRRLAIVGLAGALGVGLGLAVAWAQVSPSVVRLAFVPQWVIQQHRARGALNPALREAVEGGVVDRTVFAWQRGVIQRQALVAKPIRLVPDPEASALGGRGRFTLGAVRPPAGRAAWTDVEISRGSDGADDVLVLEIGAERNTVTQVLETLLLAEPGRAFVEVPLARPALMAGDGVPVVQAPFEQPLPPAMAQRFREEAGMGILVVRSPLWDVRNGDLTSSGRADTVPFSATGDWRDSDRIFLRVPVAALVRGVPGLVLGWKDRTLQNDPDIEFPRRSALPFPAVR
jgi:hypothetical protein